MHQCRSINVSKCDDMLQLVGILYLASSNGLDSTNHVLI